MAAPFHRLGSFAEQAADPNSEIVGVGLAAGDDVQQAVGQLSGRGRLQRAGPLSLL